MTKYRVVLITAVVCLALIGAVYADSNVIESKYNRVLNTPPYPVSVPTTELHC